MQKVTTNISLCHVTLVMLNMRHKRPNINQVAKTKLEIKKVPTIEVYGNINYSLLVTYMAIMD